MNLKKAIEIVELNIKEAGSKMPADTLTALKLENEASHFIVLSRVATPRSVPTLLQGETLDSLSP